ncbi:hypothetical protein PR048_009940 [Dryococelus australis]|uniref:DDE Tnp4 domain-containing protein n=1 Tax=Dryococelus australis TaxID=614101 RepID=A0ABQ9I1B9_9NEOP|nr:hypothetical protein PR048_009940 [Dryococelus australis]
MALVDDVVFAMAVSCYLWKKTRKRFSVHLINMQHLSMGQFHTLFHTLRRHPDKFFSYFCMSVMSFDELCNFIKNAIQKQNTSFGAAIASDIVILQFFLSFFSQILSNWKYIYISGFRVQDRQVNDFRNRTYKKRGEAIWCSMKEHFMPELTPEDWLRISNEFLKRCNTPLCLGALDGKHLRFVNPSHSGLFYKYKCSFSIVLLTLVNANYCFTAINVGEYGKSSDGNILKKSILYH